MAILSTCIENSHSEYSPLDGLGSADQYAERAAELGQSALALTDHATLGGALHHIKACRENDIIPIVGVEGYFRDDRRAGKNSDVDHNKAMHLVLLASSRKGWKSLLRITSEAYTTGDEDGHGFYGKPVMDWDLLQRHNEGLICSTACVSGPICDPFLRQDDDSRAVNNLNFLLDIFGERLWLEIMPHDFDNQRRVNPFIINLAQERGIGVIATGDAHIPRKEWTKTHLILQMHATRQTMAERKQKREAGEDVYGSEIDTLYLMSEQEMKESFAKYHPNLPQSIVDEALSNTGELVKSMHMYHVDRDPKLPSVKGDGLKILDEWCWQGMRRIKKEFDGEYIKRLDYERGVLVKNGVTDYFCIVGDLVRWARSDNPLPGDIEPKKPIRVGLGRGSAAGSLISYLVGITSIDPIAYGLLFERFLNPDRKGLPDIDLDFSSAGREQVKEYLRRKYGYDHVADIIAHQYFAPRALITDLGRIYGIPPFEQNAVKDTIGPLERGIEKIAIINLKLREFAEKYPELWEHAKILDDGLHRPSKHAAGVVVTRDPIYEHIPLQLSKQKAGERAAVVTAWSDRADFQIISDFGFLKLDILGIEDLDRQDYAMEQILSHTPDRTDPLDLSILQDPDAADPNVLSKFGEGLTIGVFQFAGGGMTNLLREIKPDRIFDIIAANALYRPGAMEYSFEYARRKHGRTPESEWYWHPAVEPFLNTTYGIVAFQEQVMAICKALGNFSGADADYMRKAISKLYRLPGDKAREFMNQWYEQWMQGCRDNSLSDPVANTIWENILSFGSYGFNLSHSASYALQAYQDMDLKVNDPLEFYSSILSLNSGEKGFVERVIREARQLEVTIHPPSVNRSKLGYTVDNGEILFGLKGVRNLGDKSVHEIMNNAPYISYEDYCTKVPSQAGGAGMSLIKAGAFDDIEEREYLLSTVAKNGKTPSEWTVAEHINHNRKLKKPRPIPDERVIPSVRQLMYAEKEMLGVVVSIEPTVDRYSDLVSEFVDSPEVIAEAEDGTILQVAGEIVEVKEITTKKGQPMAFIDLAFQSENYSCTLFPGEYVRYSEVLSEADSVIVKGRKNVFNDRISIIVNGLQNLDTFVKEQVSADT